MSRILTFAHNKLSQVLNILYTRCVELSYILHLYFMYDSQPACYAAVP